MGSGWAKAWFYIGGSGEIWGRMVKLVIIVIASASALFKLLAHVAWVVWLLI